MRTFPASAAALAALFALGPATAADTFESASSVATVRSQIERLPENDVWWTVNGPDMRWNNLNLQRIFPTVPVYRAGAVSELAYRPDTTIAEHLVRTSSSPVPFQAWLDSDASSTMGVVILHQGHIVFEHYPRQQPYEKPILWSVTKAFVGTLVAILEDRGQLQVDQPVETYLPRLADSSFAGVTVRNILDMATGVDCPEEYEDRESCYYRYSMAVGDGQWNAASPDDPYEYVANLQVGRWAEQGTAFSYSGVNTFILGWLVEELTGMPLQDALSREIWTRIGAESDAAILAPRFGVPNMHGGLMARLRDVARFGLLFTPSWRTVSPAQIVSDRQLAILLDGGRPELLRNARFGAPEAPGVKHNVYQWDLVWDNGDIYKGGWAGQGLLINPRRDLVAVWSGYYSSDRQDDPDLLPVVRDLLNTLYGETVSAD